MSRTEPAERMRSADVHPEFVQQRMQLAFQTFDCDSRLPVRVQNTTPVLVPMSSRSSLPTERLKFGTERFFQRPSKQFHPR
jgi:hypothetical protein